ncbi:MAG: SDR family NAD(P)-dependent oxidoreductase [Myxococcota bacterium]
MKDLSQRRAIVTGASRGIGVYIARALADAGMELALVARSAEPIEALAAELQSQGARAVAIAGDTGVAADRERVVQRARQELGPVDVLVNNAAVEWNGAFGGFSQDEIERTIHVDLTAPLLLTQLVLAEMLERGTGHIVNVSSLAGKGPAPYNVPYAAAKGGLVSFTQSLRAELRGTGVGVSVVCPGFVSEAGMFANKERDHGVVAPGLLGTSRPEAVARAVVRAIEGDKAELIVNPGPMRLMGAAAQVFPDVQVRLVSRLGLGEIFREVGEKERKGGRDDPSDRR